MGNLPRFLLFELFRQKSVMKRSGMNRAIEKINKLFPIRAYFEGFCFYVIVALIAAILKMLHILPFEWKWIFAPIWIPLGLTVIILVGAGIVYALKRVVWAISVVMKATRTNHSQHYRSSPTSERGS